VRAHTRAKFVPRRFHPNTVNARVPVLFVDSASLQGINLSGRSHIFGRHVKRKSHYSREDNDYILAGLPPFGLVWFGLVWRFFFFDHGLPSFRSRARSVAEIKAPCEISIATSEESKEGKKLPCVYQDPAGFVCPITKTVNCKQIEAYVDAALGGRCSSQEEHSGECGKPYKVRVLAAWAKLDQCLSVSVEPTLNPKP
jgi:hypothetical protein